MTTTPTEPTVSLLTVDDTGNPGTLPLDSLLPQPVEGEPLEAEFVGGAREELCRHVAAPAYQIKMDKWSAHWAYAKVPYEMTFESSAGDAFKHSVAVDIRGPAQGTFPQITEWHTPKPKAGETGVLTVSVLYWQSKPIWSAWWSPVVTG